ncbi:hypothetical protein [Profundibacter sp.]
MQILSHLAIIAIVSLANGEAFAGCANFEDGSLSMPAPVFEICYKSTCDITKMEYECGNMSQYSASYDIGWSIGCKIEDSETTDCSIYWQGREISKDKHQYITCRNLTDKTTCNVLRGPS